jgi:biotin operon repressor
MRLTSGVTRRGEFFTIRLRLWGFDSSWTGSEPPKSPPGGGPIVHRNLVIDGTHLSRLMKICRTLANGAGTSLQQLQTKLRMSRRTIFRDLSTLAEMGVRVDLGNNGYHIRQNAAACRKILGDYQLKAVHKLLGQCLK